MRIAPSTRIARARRIGRRPALEVLESRLALSTLVVSTTNDDPFSASDVSASGALGNHGGEVTLRSAIVANDLFGGGDTIEVPAGTYLLSPGGPGADGLSGELAVTAPLAIEGAGSGSTIVEAASAAGVATNRVLDINPGGANSGVSASISGLTIRFGVDDEAASGGVGGGGIAFDAGANGSGSLELDGVVVDQNATTGGNGGAIALDDGGSVLIVDSAIDQNAAGATARRRQGSGGGLAVGPGASGSLEIRDSTFSGNVANGPGGGLYVAGPTTIVGSTILGNSASTGGGIDGKDAAGLSVVDSRIVGNASETGPSAAAGSLGPANSDLADNWFGSNSPSGKLFAKGVVPTHLVMTFSASPSTFAQGNTATLTAAITSNSLGQAGYRVPDGTPVTFSASSGSPTPPISATTGGVASSTVTPEAGTVTVAASIDGQTLSEAVHADVGPEVTLEPASSTTVDAGQTVTLTASASGSPIPSVQWEVATGGGDDFTPIFGATATTYSFVASAADDDNRYIAVFSNAEGSVDSASAVLTVYYAPIVTANPANQLVLPGGTVSFSASANSDPGPNSAGSSVQWQISTDGGRTYNPVAGAPDSATYSFPEASGVAGADYRAVFINSVGSTPTLPATFTLAVAPVVTLEPSSTTVTAGQAVTLRAAATGSPSPSVQWQSHAAGATTFVNIPGATTPTYQFNTTAADAGNVYRAVFTNLAGTATTSPATLSLNIPPQIVQQPTDATIRSGSSVAFMASATGTPAPTIQWYKSTDGGSTFTAIPGATSTAYPVIDVSLAQSGTEYRAVFSNAFGTATTAAATLLVENPPVVTVNPTPPPIPLAAGDPVSLTASSSGSTPETVQWLVSSNNGASYLPVVIGGQTTVSTTSSSGLTTSTLSFQAASSESGDEFEAIFQNGVGTASTQPVLIYVIGPASVTLNPTDQTVNANQDVEFYSDAIGYPLPEVQWQVSADGGETWVAAPGNNESNGYVFQAKASENGDLYRAAWTNRPNPNQLPVTVYSTAATLTVNTVPVITEQPMAPSPTPSMGQVVTLQATATGNPDPTVQWYMSTDGTNFYPISGATSDVYTFAAEIDGARYFALFTNAAGSVNSNVVEVDVNS